MMVNAHDLARQTFQAALVEGEAIQPTSLQEQFWQHRCRWVTAANTLDVEALEHALASEFPFLGPLVPAGIQPDASSMASWEGALRWVLAALHNWSAGNNPHAPDQLRSLLVAVHVLDANGAGLQSVADRVDSEALRAELLRFVETAQVDMHVLSYGRRSDLQRLINSAALQGDYEQLSMLLPNVMPEPRSDLWSAIVLLWKADSSVLAQAVARKNDVVFSTLVCYVLGPFAVEFALEVPLVAFRFVSIEFAQERHRRGNEVSGWPNVLQRLFLDVARTPDWVGWMRALFRSPGRDTDMELALAEALAQLREEHWSGFVNALSLQHSHSAAEPVARMMECFAGEVEAQRANEMWRFAFQAWDDWNYGKGEEQAYMFAPAACALDYPVVMYYAQLSPAEIDTEATELLHRVETIEQQWFDSGSDLITERNRLRSRLRLVQQARAIVDGAQSVLPPSIRPDADSYSRVRYRYCDMRVK